MPKSPIIWTLPLSGRVYQVMSNFRLGFPDQIVAHLWCSFSGIPFFESLKTVNFIRFEKPSECHYNSFGNPKQFSEWNFTNVDIKREKMFWKQIYQKNLVLCSLNTPDHQLSGGRVFEIGDPTPDVWFCLYQHALVRLKNFTTPFFLEITFIFLKRQEFHTFLIQWLLFKNQVNLDLCFTKSMNKVL